MYSVWQKETRHLRRFQRCLHSCYRAPPAHNVLSAEVTQSDKRKERTTILSLSAIWYLYVSGYRWSSLKQDQTK